MRGTLESSLSAALPDGGPWPLDNGVEESGSLSSTVYSYSFVSGKHLLFR
jgi:hypothetical protein